MSKKPVLVGPEWLCREKKALPHQEADAASTQRYWTGFCFWRPSSISFWRLVSLLLSLVSLFHVASLDVTVHL